MAKRRATHARTGMRQCGSEQMEDRHRDEILRHGRTADADIHQRARSGAIAQPRVVSDGGWFVHGVAHALQFHQLVTMCLCAGATSCRICRPCMRKTAWLPCALVCVQGSAVPPRRAGVACRTSRATTTTPGSARPARRCAVLHSVRPGRLRSAARTQLTRARDSCCVGIRRRQVQSVDLPSGTLIAAHQRLICMPSHRYDGRWCSSSDPDHRFLYRPSRCWPNPTAAWRRRC